jgi:class 3 adenylate cyclase
MIEHLKGLLQETTSQSKWIVAVFADVRGFSSFCERVDSAEAATFMKKTCTILIDRYFSDASFLKPTGDGLLAVYEYKEGEGTEPACKIVETCLLLTKEFGSFFSDDEYMVACGVPDKVGIGIAMGPVGCLISDSQVLDYSGKPLNLASRLMSMARPRGIVVDAKIGGALQKRPDLKEEFKIQTVYAHGIAELKPIPVFYSPEYTSIPRIYLQPLTDYNWEDVDFTHTLTQWKRIAKGHNYGLSVKKAVIDPHEATITIWYPKRLWKKTGAHYFYLRPDSYRYEIRAGRHIFRITDLERVVAKLAKEDAKDSDKITLRIRYPSVID